VEKESFQPIVKKEKELWTVDDDDEDELE